MSVSNHTCGSGVRCLRWASLLVFNGCNVMFRSIWSQVTDVSKVHPARHHPASVLLRGNKYFSCCKTWATRGFLERITIVSDVQSTWLLIVHCAEDAYQLRVMGPVQPNRVVDAPDRVRRDLCDPASGNSTVNIFETPHLFSITSFLLRSLMICAKGFLPYPMSDGWLMNYP